MINAVLIANRGEIVCRIVRTCRRLGIRTVAVYADADAHARHVRLADEAVHIGPSAVSDSYLVIEKIIAAAERAEVDAVHPGFGFLAENADFARACEAAGLIFIGPSAAAIEAMGNKRAAKALMVDAGVPTIPGYSGEDQSDERLQQEAGEIGFPLMVKAAAGGGGKGMRLVDDPEALPAALAAARREAAQAFSSDELILEKGLLQPRHIEFQVFGDHHGNVIHLGERECSIQRRHQKVIEETPSPALTAVLREEMGATAVSAARAINYVNAGTVECLLDSNGSFYFLEMNTRLQVEHPVTEMVTGIDLVAWQIRIAEGASLPLRQEAIKMQGHAVEARLYAENPANNFLPVTGRILQWRAPSGEGVRVDSGIQSGDEVSIYYDPMLAKIVAHGPDRVTAVRRLARALQTSTLLGLTNNLTFLQEILQHPAFQDGNLSTHFIADHFAAWQAPQGNITLALLALTLAQWQRHSQPDGNNDYWRNNFNRPPRYRYQVAAEDEPVEVQLTPLPRIDAAFRLAISTDPQRQYSVLVNAQEDHDWVLTVDGYRQRVTAVSAGASWWVQTRSGVVSLKALPRLPLPPGSAAAGGSLRAPMPGSVLEVLVEVGQRVKKGQPLMKLEAMKMEHTIRTAADGIVEAIYYAANDTVEADAQLLKIAEVGD